MKKNAPILSFCIPLYNEEQTLYSSLIKIEDGLEKIFGKNNFEILLADNGSTDNTPLLLKKISKNFIKTIYLKKRGQGLAYKKCISMASGIYVGLSAIDLPFGFDDTKQAQKLWNRYDVIYGSKNHPDSKILVSRARKITSYIYNEILLLLFSINISDTQGTVFMKRDIIPQILSRCNSNDAFFTAQIAIYAAEKKLKCTEIPVHYNAMRKGVRKSRYNIIRDGSIMLSSILKEYIKINF